MNAPAAQQVVAVMKFKKETTNKTVYEETDDSPAGGLVGTLYLSKYAVKNMLGGADTITLLIEAGDTRPSS